MNPGRNPELWRDPPPPLRGAERGSWAHTSIVDRLPKIGRRALRENDFSPSLRTRVEALIAEIPAGPIMPIEDPRAPDAAAWAEYVQPYQGSDWLQPPWFFVETYFYRHLAAIAGYFQSGLDPFRVQKERGLEKAPEVIRQTMQRQTLGQLLLAALWGNRADLSLWPEGDHADQQTRGSAAGRVLRDDRDRIERYLAGQSSLQRIDVLLDNGGAELAADLCLADALLQRHPELTLHLHAKAHPTFVSDVTVFDVEHALHRLRGAGDPIVARLAARLQRALAAGRLRLVAPMYWTSPLPGWQMPAELRQELAGSDLLLSKGDANYRRLLGDRRWPPDTPLQAIVSYLPAPLAALRTLKSDLAAGLSSSAVEQARAADPDWMINGRWALIQFAGVGGGN